MNKVKSPKDIIDSHIKSDPSKGETALFERLVLNEDSQTGSALRKIWNEADTDTDADLPDAKRVFSSARKEERRVNSKRNRSYFLFCACAAAVLAAVVLLYPRPTSIIVSSDSERLSYVLPDSSKVWLNTGSSVSYRGRLNGRIRKVSLHGEAFFDVAKDSRHPFVVRTSDMDITVLGTKFTVSAFAGKHVAAYLEEGSIKVKGKGFPDTVLEPGQSISFNDSTLSWMRTNVNVSNHTSWIKPELSFSNASMRDILENLEHWFNVSIQCEDSSLLDKSRLSLTVRDESVDEIMSALSSLTGTVYNKKDNTIIISYREHQVR